VTSLKLTKNSLRDQELQLQQLRKYLPTLQLKKALLQLEVQGIYAQLQSAQKGFEEKRSKLESFQKLLDSKGLNKFFQAIEIERIEAEYENIAGLELPIFKGVVFLSSTYSLFDTPLWWDLAIDLIKDFLSTREERRMILEKKRILEKELREVSIRVNLFEKILIPRSMTHIKKIKIFLGDQQLAAIAQAKVAKRKIANRKKALYDL